MVKNIVHVSGSTQKIYQLTGECDRERNEFTINRTQSRFGLIGTDLGSSFEHNGRIYFLFGDTTPVNPHPYYRPLNGGDSIAYTEDRDPEMGIRLSFVTSSDDPNNYLSPRIGSEFNSSMGNITLKEFEVPTAGFSANNKMYVFFTTGHFLDSENQHVMGKSFLASSDDAAQSPFHFLYYLSDINGGGKFINVSTVIVNNVDIPGLPETTGQGLLLWGSGLYRRSNPCLAYLPLTGIESRQNLRYFAGIEAGSHRPIWSMQESDATILFDHPKLGELSVSWNQFLGVWLMLYNADSPRGINFRVAEKPWGPWSEASVLFEPRRDNGYCHFIHQSWIDGVCDFVYDGPSPWGAFDWGGEYGPYVISQYTKGTNNHHQSTIYFVMSTWNPYNTVLMKSTLAREPGETNTQLSSNPVIIQSSLGINGNFQAMSPQLAGGLVHYWRNNDNPNLPWSMPNPIAAATGQFNAVSFIQSNFGNPGNLEVVARSGNNLVWFWRESQTPSFNWHGPYPLVIEDPSSSQCSSRQVAAGVAGNPVLIQSKFGQKGNFELVVPRVDRGFDHFFRDNDHPALPWIRAPSVGSGQGRIDAISMIQSNFGDPGNLEVVARIGNRLVYFWRESTVPFQWHGPFPIIADGEEIEGVTGNPVLIQSTFGSKGNFELVVPLRNGGNDSRGGLSHYFRDNDSGELQWHKAPIVDPSTRYEAVSLVQGNFGNPGNLEVIARVGDQLVHLWREADPDFRWHGPFSFTAI
jgi:hypothetical protein